MRRRLNADGDELVHTVNLEPESPRSVEPLWDVPRRRRFPITPTPPTVDDSYRERRREATRPDPEVIVFSRMNNSSDSEPHSIPVNARRPPSRRRGWGNVPYLWTGVKMLIMNLGFQHGWTRTATRSRPMRRRWLSAPGRPRGGITLNRFSIFFDLSFEGRAIAPQRLGITEMRPRVRCRHSRTAWTLSNPPMRKLRCVRFLGPREEWMLMVPWKFVNQNTGEPEGNDARAVDYVNPLPMPLHEMICNPNKRTEPWRHNTKRKSPRRAIQVNPSGQLAGR